MKGEQKKLEVRYVDPAELKSSKYRFTKMSDEGYQRLKTSIDASGFSEQLPIKVREMDNEELEIVDGHHRNDIALELKLKRVPIVIHTYNSESEVVSDAIQSNKDRGGINYFEVSRSWEDIFGPYEKGKHGEHSQEEIGKFGGGFSKSAVSEIRQIYPRLKNILSKFDASNFSNRQLVFLARVENGRLRKALLGYADKLSSDELQEKATLCNKISKYIEKKVKGDSELEDMVYDRILSNNIIFKDSLEALQLLVDEIVGMPIRHLPRYIEGNALDVLPEIPTTSLRLIITSPPYGSLKDYKEKGQITSLTGYKRYLSELQAAWEDCFRVLLPGGRIIVVVGDEVVSSGTDSPHRVTPIHADITKQCLDIGYTYMSNIIWQKVNVARPSGGGAFPGSYPFPCECLINQDHEYLLIFRKPGDTPPESQVAKEASRISQEEWSSLINSIWNIPGEKKTHHPAPFPGELVDRVIKMFSFRGETVLDPFVGSGTTCLSAMKMGRRSIGIEVKKEYIETAEKLTKNIVDTETDFRYIVGE